MFDTVVLMMFCPFYCFKSGGCAAILGSPLQ